MVDIFDEVDEELRADKAQAVLKQYGGLILAAAFAVVLGVAGWQGWQWWQARQDQAAAIRFLAAMRIADNLSPMPGLAAPDDAATAARRGQAMTGFAGVAADGPAGYRALSRLREAGLKADAGDLPAAVSIWNSIAGDGSVDPLLRDLANLLAVLRQLDTGDAAQLAARLKPMAEANSPWRALAQEQLALLDIRMGQTEAAKETLGRLSRDTAAPIGVRNRAGAMLARLGGPAGAAGG